MNSVFMKDKLNVLDKRLKILEKYGNQYIKDIKIKMYHSNYF